MKAEHSLWLSQRVLHFTNAQAGRIARENTYVGYMLFQINKQVGFKIHPLWNGFHHKIGNMRNGRNKIHAHG